MYAIILCCFQCALQVTSASRLEQPYSFGFAIVMLVHVRLLDETAELFWTGSYRHLSLMAYCSLQKFELVAGSLQCLDTKRIR